MRFIEASILGRSWGTQMRVGDKKRRQVRHGAGLLGIAFLAHADMQFTGTFVGEVSVRTDAHGRVAILIDQVGARALLAGCPRDGTHLRRSSQAR